MVIMNQPIINRVWAMPNKWTFRILPIKKLLDRYVGDGKGWIDPFAGESSPAEITNDICPNRKATSHIDALEFLISFSDNFSKGIFFDPPYSITQAKQCYDSFGCKELDIKVSSMKYWAEIKNNMARILEPNGIAICCGWSSMGLGINRGFEMIEVLLVPHGGSKNDTIVTVERKINRSLDAYERVSK